jgi:glycosyltransferase involved in cell wall biosynthesis
MFKHKIIILGKIPPPYMGTSIWFDILCNSSLTNHFDIHWLNVNVHKDFSRLGKSYIKNILPNVRLYFQFFNLLKNFRPKLVLIPISQSTPGFLKDSIFIRLVPKKSRTLIILHGSNLKNWLNNSSSWINRYFSDTLKNTYGAVVLGNNLRYLFFPWFPQEKIFVVPNGLTIKSTQRPVKNGSTIIIRYIGSLTDAKGIVEIIEAINLLKNSQNKFQLVLNGVWRDTKIRNKCEKIIEEKSLPIYYEGQVTGEDKSLAYSKSDIFVFTPNKPEGHPLVIIEAMAAGLPIISTDQGAITESVFDMINGFIVKPNCPEEIAEKIKYLIDNPAERIRMGKESRRLYEENFTEEKMVGRLINVFNQVLEEK